MVEFVIELPIQLEHEFTSSFLRNRQDYSPMLRLSALKPNCQGESYITHGRATLLYFAMSWFAITACGRRNDWS